MTTREELNQLNENIKEVTKSLSKQAKYWKKIAKYKKEIEAIDKIEHEFNSNSIFCEFLKGIDNTKNVK